MTMPSTNSSPFSPHLDPPVSGKGLPIWAAFFFCILIFLAGLLFHALVGRIIEYPARYAAVALFSVLVGSTELVARYKDNPVAALQTVPAFIYCATNAVAAILALWVLQRNDVKFDLGGTLPADIGQVLLAGFGTMVFFRSALFTIRVGDSDVSIGPAAVLQIILNAADRACDRLRAGPRSLGVYKIMRGVSFERAKLALPLHCFALMQNISTAEQTQLSQTIDALAAKVMPDDVKAYNLGLLMMNVVGEDVLREAVNVLSTLVIGPSADEPPIFAQAAQLTGEDVTALVSICVAFDPLARDDKKAADLQKDIKTRQENLTNAGDQNIIAIAILRARFGASTVSRALALLAANRKPAGTPSNAPLTSADLQKK